MKEKEKNKKGNKRAKEKEEKERVWTGRYCSPNLLNVVEVLHSKLRSVGNGHYDHCGKGKYD